MKLRMFLVPATLSLFLVACATYFVAHRDIDDLESPFSIDKFFLYSSLDARDSISIIKWSGTETRYTLTVEYVGSTWRFMEGEARVRTDSGIRKYTTKPLRDVMGSLVHETMHFEIPAETIREFMNSSQIYFQYYGEPIQITKEKQSQLKRFYKEYVSK